MIDFYLEVNESNMMPPWSYIIRDHTKTFWLSVAEDILDSDMRWVAMSVGASKLEEICNQLGFYTTARSCIIPNSSCHTSPFILLLCFVTCTWPAALIAFCRSLSSSVFTGRKNWAGLVNWLRSLLSILGPSNLETFRCVQPIWSQQERYQLCCGNGRLTCNQNEDVHDIVQQKLTYPYD